jgi:hypothetical protein
MEVFTASMFASNGISGTPVCAQTDELTARNATAANALNVRFIVVS